jgi:putative FmdB family regulatory protein
MPLYEYRCEDCGRRVTIWRSFSETSPPHCPICGGENLTRLISQVSVVKSERDRTKDLSWIDRDVARRFRNKAGGKPSPEFEETLDRMESA